MAQAIAAGAVAAGSFLLANAGTIISVGATVASILLSPRPQDQNVTGPRAGDTGVTTSTYGQTIPIAFGSVRLGSNVIWLKNEQIDEVVREDESGGKGGGPTTTTTTFSYFATFAVGLAEGPVDGLLRLWMNNKLVYDARPTTELFFKYPSASLTFYPGDETQEPDPDIEADKGVGNVPAHRGLCYLVFRNLPLADFGNGLPQSISAEIQVDQSSTFPVIEFSNQPALPDTIEIRSDGVQDTDISWDSQRGAVYGGDPDGLWKLNLTTNNVDVHNPPSFYDSRSPNALVLHDDDSVFVTLTDAGGDWKFVRLEKQGLGILLEETASHSLAGDGVPRCGAVVDVPELASPGFPNDNKYAVIGTGVNFFLYNRFDMQILDTVTDPMDFGGSESAAVDRDNVVWFVGGASTGSQSVQIVRCQVVSTPGEGVHLSTRLIDLSSALPNTGRPHSAFYDEAAHALVFATFTGGSPTGGPRLIKWDIASESITIDRDPDVDFGVEMSRQAQISFENTLPGQAEIIYTDGADNIARVQVSDLTLVATYDSKDWEDGGSNALQLDAFSGILDPVSNSIVATGEFSGAPDSTVVRLFVDRKLENAVTLQSVLEALSIRAGLSLSDLDFSDLTADTVRGLVLINRGEVRNPIDQLSLRYFFDVVESDFLVKFRSRGRAPDFFLVEEDLGAGVGSKSDAPHVAESRVQEVELPEEIDVAYLDKGRDYQRDVQVAKRISQPDPTMFSGSKETIELSVVDEAAQARQVAEKSLAMTWLERDQARVRLLPQFIALDPTDVLTITRDDGEVLQVRATKTDLGAGLIAEVEAATDRPEIYSSSIAAAAGAGFADVALTVPGSSQLLVLDVPLLRDADSTGREKTGPYTGIAALSESWRGGVLHRSGDGSTWSQYGATSTPLVRGTATAAGAANPDPFQWDRDTALTVSVGVGASSLASATETQLLADSSANGALWGTELIQYANVTDNGDGTVTLDTLIRGRRGTEQAARDGHPAGELVTFLAPEGLSRTQLDVSTIGTTRFYRAVSLGDLFDLADVEQIVVSGLDLTPYAPAHPSRSFDGSDNLTLTWIRQTRVGGTNDLLDGVVGVPLSEDSEAYEVDVLDAPGGNVLRTITSTTSANGSVVTPSTQSALYDADDMVLDGIVPGDQVHVNIYQISAQVGRGRPLAFTAPAAAQDVSVSFDGSSEYMANTTEQAIGISDTWSMSFWLKFNDLTGVQYPIDIKVGANENARAIVRWRGDLTPKRLQVIQRNDVGVDRAAHEWNDLVTATGAWHHVAVAFDNSAAVADRLTLWLDGVEVAPDSTSGGGTSTVSDLSRQVHVAALTGGFSHFNGLMGPVTVWSALLDQDDVDEVFAGKFGFTPLLDGGTYDKSASNEHWWRLGRDPTDIGKDSGGGTAIDIDTNSVGITSADIVEDFPT